MTALTPEAVGAALTKAQRRVVLAIDGEPMLPKNGVFSANAAFNLIRKGVTKLVFDRSLLRDRYDLTPLGQQVRELLSRDPAP